MITLNIARSVKKIIHASYFGKKFNVFLKYSAQLLKMLKIIFRASYFGEMINVFPKYNAQIPNYSTKEPKY